MVLASSFQNQPKALANYSYADIASGTGYIRFYLSQINNSTGVAYLLRDTVLDTYKDAIEGSSVTDTTDDSIDVDFFTPSFNVPRIVGGTLYASIRTKNSGSGDVDTYKIQFAISKYDGTTTTAIVSGESGTYNDFNSNSVVFSFSIPNTQLHVGEQLKVNIKANVNEQGTGTAFMVIGTSPTAEDYTITGGAAGTITACLSYIDIPFRIDL